MSRSFKHTPIHGIASARSEKQFKRFEHARFRANVRDLLRHELGMRRGLQEAGCRPLQDADLDLCYPDYRGRYGNPWDGPKDGKTGWYSWPAVWEWAATERYPLWWLRDMSPQDRHREILSWFKK